MAANLTVRWPAIRINPPLGFGGGFGLNVQKSAIVAPPGFQEAVMGAVAMMAKLSNNTKGLLSLFTAKMILPCEP
jgi:hypothetical protein